MTSNGIDTQLEAIENLLMDIDLLSDLELRLSTFNAFETLGVVNTEIKHSNVLAWLLSPRETHGFGDVVIKSVVQKLFHDYKNELTSVNLSLIQVTLMDFYDFHVRREWKNIDLTLSSEENNLVIVIENKIWSGESPHQLEKYYKIIEEEFPSYEKIFIFLTPDGSLSSDTERWLSVGYPFFIDNIERILHRKRDGIAQSVQLFIEHYIEILRRHIVGDNELAKICREIYYKHQKAFDLIFEHRPDVYSDISNFIDGCLSEYSNIVKDSSNKSLVRFLTTSLDLQLGQTGKGWTNSNRQLLYEFQNRNENLVLKLIIGPGDPTLREKIYNIARDNPTLFKGKSNSLTPQWTQIYSKELMPKGFLEKDEALDVIQEKIKRQIDKFVTGDLLTIDKAILGAL